MIPYLLESKHLLDHYINLDGDYFYEIKFSHTYFDYMRPMHQSDIIKIIIYYKIVKKKLLDKNESYNNKRRIV